jgi:hypothetical protein
LILRLVESHGGSIAIDIQWHLPVRDVNPVDLLEQPRREPCVAHDAGMRRTSIALRPFQIVTLAATLDALPR